MLLVVMGSMSMVVHGGGPSKLLVAKLGGLPNVMAKVLVEVLDCLMLFPSFYDHVDCSYLMRLI